MLIVKCVCLIELMMYMMGGKWKGIILFLLLKLFMYYNVMCCEILGII